MHLCLRLRGRYLATVEGASCLTQFTVPGCNRPYDLSSTARIL